MKFKHFIIASSILLGLWHTFTLVSSTVDVHLTFGKPYYQNDTKFIDLSKIRVKKMNKTHHIVDGEMELFRSIGDEYDVQINVFQRKGNEIKKMPLYTRTKKFCNFFREEKLVYPDLRNYTDFPSITTCPWPKQIYHFYSYLFKIDKLPSIMPDGEYMAQWMVLRDGKIINGYIVFGTIENFKLISK